MKNLLYLFILLFALSCTDTDAPKDTETNKFYADYMKIYQAYDSLGNEKTLEALTGYLNEFPEQQSAYNFKGYILAKMGNLEEAYENFDYARSLDSTAIISYEYQTGFMLFDTSTLDETALLIEKGMAQNDSSGHLYNHRAWLKLLNRDPQGALNDVTDGINRKPNLDNLYRTGFIAAVLVENDSAQAFYSEKITTLEIASPDSLKSLMNQEVVYGVLKSLY